MECNYPGDFGLAKEISLKQVSALEMSRLTLKQLNLEKIFTEKEVPRVHRLTSTDPKRAKLVAEAIALNRRWECKVGPRNLEKEVFCGV